MTNGAVRGRRLLAAGLAACAALGCGRALSTVTRPSRRAIYSDPMWRDLWPER